MEQWKAIKGYPAYEVSDSGRVRRIVRGYRNGRIGIMKQFDMLGYWKVFLSRDAKSKQYLVHRLVAQAFIPNPNNLPTVNHINGRRKTNRLTNLEWASRARQIIHAQLTGLKPAKGYYKTRSGSWHVQMTVQGKYIDLGSFKRESEAKAARAAAVKIYQSLEATP
jgi:NUMOD4 motif